MLTAGIESLFRAHRELVLAYLLRRTGNRATAEDLAQETFLRATRAFLGWRQGRPEAWLLAIAHNVLIDHVRKEPRLEPIEEALLSVDRSDPEKDAAVREALGRMPQAQARLLTLIHIQGFTYAEVAAMAGSTTGAVKTAGWRARQVFRSIYEESTYE